VRICRKRSGGSATFAKRLVTQIVGIQVENNLSPVAQLGGTKPEARNQGPPSANKSALNLIIIWLAIFSILNSSIDTLDTFMQSVFHQTSKSPNERERIEALCIILSDWLSHNIGCYNINKQQSRRHLLSANVIYRGALPL
jgi:hypothetical protein